MKDPDNPKNPKVVAIIQARVGSSRLPGKSLRSLHGQPMVAHVLERCARSQSLSAVWLAIPDTAQNDPLEDFAASGGWPVYRGSENDVLSRYVGAARASAATHVVRITSDCPLIDPEVIDATVSLLFGSENSAVVASNTFPRRTFPRGLDVEIVTTASLETAYQEDHDPSSREHVTTYLLAHPERFPRVGWQLDGEDYSQHRWTVDEAEDFELVSCLYDALGGNSFHWRDALCVLSAHPEWAEINRHIRQKNV